MVAATRGDRSSVAPAITRGNALERVALERVEVGSRQGDDDDAQRERAVGNGQAPESHDDQDGGDADPRDVQRVADVMPVGDVGERVVDGRERIGERSVMGLLLLDLERFEEPCSVGGADPTEVRDRAGNGGHDCRDLAGPPAPAVGAPGADHLNGGGDGQQAADRAGGSRQVAEEAGPPPVPPPYVHEECNRQQHEKRLRVAHHEDKRGRGQHDQPHRPPRHDGVLELGADQRVDADPQQERGGVGDHERRDTDGE